MPLLPDLPDDLQLPAALQFVAKKKGIDLVAMDQKQQQKPAQRFIPVFFTEDDLGPEILKLIYREYKLGTSIAQIIRKTQPYRMRVGQPALTLVDVYAVLMAAKQQGLIGERGKRDEFTIEAFRAFYRMWRDRVPLQEVRRSMAGHIPNENVFQGAQRSLNERFDKLGCATRVSPRVLADVPLVEMLRYAERMQLPTVGGLPHDPAEVCMVIRISRLPLGLRQILKELYCFKGRQDAAFSVDKAIAGELQVLSADEVKDFTEGLQKSPEQALVDLEKKAAAAKRVTIDRTRFTDRRDPFESTPHDEPLVPIPESPVAAAVQQALAPPAETGMRIRSTGVQRVYEANQNGPMPDPIPEPPEELGGKVPTANPLASINTIDDFDDFEFTEGADDDEDETFPKETFNETTPDLTNDEEP